jgi:uncharacterized membrane protein YGL010W
MKNACITAGTIFGLFCDVSQFFVVFEVLTQLVMSAELVLFVICWPVVLWGQTYTEKETKEIQSSIATAK